MKRAEINKQITYAINYMRERTLPLPGFAYWTEDEWIKNKEENQEILETMLGWDVTDFGLGDFYKYGLVSFVFRNGSYHNRDKYPKPYAEKMLLVHEGQELPLHYHWYKIEDIINRGGGNLIMQLYNGNKDGSLRDDDVTVSIDGKSKVVKAGSKITLKPGQSITLKPYQYHSWYAEKGPIMLFEVSTTNDDFTDNNFYKDLPRIPQIEEDEEKEYLVFSDYKDL